MPEDLPRIQWRRSPRARRMKIALCPWRGIELVLPRGASEAQGKAFLDSRRDWMEKAWRRIRQRVPEAFDTTAPNHLDLAAIPRRHELRYEPEASRLTRRGDTLVVPGAATPANARLRLKPWLMDEARRILPGRVEHLSQETGLKHQRVHVRDQRTRWGSCSSRGTISLNFRILFHAPRVVDYLILHELCHTRHMNHGADFKALLERFEPEWSRLDRELSRPDGGVPGWLGFR